MREIRVYHCDHATGPHAVGCMSRPVTADTLSAALVEPLHRRRVVFHGPLPQPPLSDVDEVAREVIAHLEDPA